MANFIRLFAANYRKSPATAAFIATSMLVILIVILVYPAATGAVIAIMGAAPAFLNALAAFIVASISKAQEQEQPASIRALPSDKSVNQA